MYLPLTTKNLPQLPGGWNSADQKTELGSPQSAVAGIVTDTDLQSIITIDTAGAGGEVTGDGKQKPTTWQCYGISSVWPVS